MSSDKEWEFTGELKEDMSLAITGASSLKRILWNLVGQKLIIKITIFRSKRSDKQNRYFWGVVVVTVRAWLLETEGRKYTKDEVYVWLNQEVLGNKPTITTILGTDVITMSGKRFSQMNTKEFEEAAESIRQTMAQRGCNIPEPHQENFITDFIEDN